MYPEVLENNRHLFFTNQDEFTSPFMFVRGFQYKNVLVGMHDQEFTEINIVTGGCGVHYIKNRRLPARTGDVFFILPGYNHGYMGDKDFEVYNLTIHKRFLDKHLPDLQPLPAFSVLFQAEPVLRASSLSPLHLSLTQEQLLSLGFLMKEIINYSTPSSYSDALICNSLVIVIISRLCMFYMENVGTVEHLKQKRDKAFLNALSLIHDHYQDNIKIDTLAEISHLSRSAFIHRFHEVCGTSPYKYLLRCRIDAAARLLQTTELPISEIVDQTGFYDTSHFTRTFKSLMGVSPVNYRKGQG